MQLAPALIDALRKAGISVTDRHGTRVGGGCIHKALRVDGTAGPLMLKVNTADRLAMFEAEVDGLDALRETRAVSVPRVLACGLAEQFAFLALEWLDLARATAESDRILGRQLARMHRSTGAEAGVAYGWHRDNFIGTTPQPNKRAPAKTGARGRSHAGWALAADTSFERGAWSAFVREARLGFQLQLAVRKALPADIAEACERLLAGLDKLFGDHDPAPSLLHGDLWSGNRGADRSGNPYVFDPAVYRGDREVDIAMTRLFGGFSDAFHAAYEAEYPLPDGAAQRVDIYNLYHLLNHYNLFGEGYIGSIRRALAGLKSRSG
jgi:protein-ribulosamine 3-kinase